MSVFDEPNPFEDMPEIYQKAFAESELAQHRAFIYEAMCQMDEMHALALALLIETRITRYKRPLHRLLARMALIGLLHTLNEACPAEGNE